MYRYCTNTCKQRCQGITPLPNVVSESALLLIYVSLNVFVCFCQCLLNVISACLCFLIYLYSYLLSMFGWFCIQVQARSKSYVLANLLITLTFHECLNMIHIIESLTQSTCYQHTSFTQSHTHSCKLEFFVCLLFYTSAPCLTFRHTLILW